MHDIHTKRHYIKGRRLRSPADNNNNNNSNTTLSLSSVTGSSEIS